MNSVDDGRWIRHLRRQLGLSQKEIAAQLGVSNVSVSRWEQGRVRPSAKVVRQLLALASQEPGARPDTLTSSASWLSQHGRFFGRTRERVLARATLESEGAVALIGPPGSGKTRLAIELARELATRFPDGQHVVDLTAVASFEEGAVLTARQLGLGGVSAEEAERRVGALLQGRRILIVVDNCEHIPAAASALIRLLRASDSVSVIATSRMAFPGDNLPAIAIGPLESEVAASLFRDRAGAADPVAADPAIDRLCRKLDYLPLAIELAAAQTHLMTVEQISGRIDASLGALHDLTGATASLAATIDRSYDLLDPQTQKLFRRLGLFAGSFDIEAADAVFGKRAGDPATLRAIAELVRQSLVAVEPGRLDGMANRYRLLETIRQYAREKLEEQGETVEALTALCAHLEALAEQGSLKLHGPDHPAVMARLEPDLPNIAAAVDLALTIDCNHEAIRLCEAIWPVWNSAGHLVEGASRFRGTLGAGPDIETLPPGFLVGAATLLSRTGDLGRAAELAQCARAAARNAGLLPVEARALDTLGLIEQRRGELDDARAAHQEAIDVWKLAGDAAGHARSLMLMGQLDNVRGDHSTAEARYTEAWELSQRSSDLDLEASLLLDLGEVAARLGKLEQAVGYLEHALACNERLANPDRAAAITANLAEVRSMLGDHDRAVADAQSAVEQYRALGNRAHLGDALYVLGAGQLAAGQTSEGIESLQESLSIYEELGNDVYVAETVQAIAAAIAGPGHSRTAARWIGATRAFQERAGVRPYAHFDLDGLLHTLRAALVPGGFQEAYDEGTRIPLAQVALEAMHYALPVRPKVPAATARGVGPCLTDRQIEVMRLVVEGSSNREIAKSLGISERTVERHLSAIYTAMSVDRRAAAVKRAVDLGLT